MKTRKRFAITLTGYLLLIAMMLSFCAVLPVSVYAADTSASISASDSENSFEVPTEDPENNDGTSPAVWIAISVGSVVLIAGAVAALMFIKKKKGIE